MISGTELAQRFPATAARVVVRAWWEGGDVGNAWDVLLSAYPAEQARDMVAAFAGPDAEAILATLPAPASAP